MPPRRIKIQSFFYDAQIRRFLLQFTRIFSGFQVEYGNETDGVNNAALLRVPIRYGDASRNAQNVLQNNSSSSMPSTPLMTFYVNALNYDRPRVQEPFHVNKISVRQRTYDEATESYDTTQGNAFTVERIMPVPYQLGLTLDVWTSNTNQKMQLLEQILTLFNPSLEVQSTDNYIDWTSLSVVELESVQWTSRTIPMGTENPIDIATLKFTLPIWISPPAKVKKLGVVERIITSMYDAQGDLNEAVYDSDLLLGTRMAVSPWNYKLVVIENKIQCVYDPTVVPDGSLNDLTPTSIVAGSNLLWPAVISAYGVLRPGISQIRLFQSDDTAIVGTVVIDPNDDRLLIYDIDPDTAPQNTLSPITAIIDPLISGPNYGLPAPAVGQRYLLTDATGATINTYPPEAWQGAVGQQLVASANDVIEWTGIYWRIVFNSVAQADTIQYVTNITTGVQYEWTGAEWVKSYQGVYVGGTWSLVL